MKGLGGRKIGNTQNEKIGAKESKDMKPWKGKVVINRTKEGGREGGIYMV